MFGDFLRLTKKRLLITATATATTTIDTIMIRVLPFGLLPLALLLERAMDSANGWPW